MCSVQRAVCGVRCMVWSVRWQATPPTRCSSESGIYCPLRSARTFVSTATARRSAMGRRRRSPPCRAQTVLLQLESWATEKPARINRVGERKPTGRVRSRGKQAWGARRMAMWRCGVFSAVPVLPPVAPYQGSDSRCPCLVRHVVAASTRVAGRKSHPFA